MRIGVDVGGTNTDAVLIEGTEVVASTKQATTADVSSGVSAAISTLLADAHIAPRQVSSVMIGTTHFTNALVERNRLDSVGVLRLASPSGDALPPMTAWPGALAEKLGRHHFMLPGGYEVDGREIAPFDEERVKQAVRSLRADGISSIAISSAFAPLNPAMEKRAAQIVAEEYPEAQVSLSHEIGRLGLVERENGVILNAALTSLAAEVVSSFGDAMTGLGLDAHLFISQNDGTLISARQARRYPVMTMGSGPTNSMRGAAYLTGISDGIVLDIGGTTSDIGVLSDGFPRESSIAVDIGGVRTNFRMPDILSLGLGGGTRIHLDPQAYKADALEPGDLRIGPDSVGYRITKEAFVFGGSTLTASDFAVMTGRAGFGDTARLPRMGDAVIEAMRERIRAIITDGIDRMKTSSVACDLIAVGGAAFLIDEQIEGISRIVRPPHAAVANAVGAAIAQVGGQVDQIIDYDEVPRETALENLRVAATQRVAAAGGDTSSVRIVEIDEVFLSYLPGHAAQVRVKAVGDLLINSADSAPSDMRTGTRVSHAY